jgi:RNA polymerase subunit RPABC4/transcription elongation factor Spt4
MPTIAGRAYWKCRNCAEIVPDDFDVCWKCGADRGGAPNPSFVVAVGPVAQTNCHTCGYPLCGLPSSVCPECGTRFDPTPADTASDETRIQSRRRSSRFASKPAAPTVIMAIRGAKRLSFFCNFAARRSLPMFQRCDM